MAEVDPGFAAELARALDGKVKPPGSLGRLEPLAAQIAQLQGRLDPRLGAARLVIFAADHGIASEGVSAYPQAVTRQMLAVFLAGGAAATVFARTLGVAVTVVDAGVAGPPLAHPALVSRRIGSGTANSRLGPAMTPAEADRTLEAGHEIGAAIAEDALLLGEMGIANSSAAALLLAKLWGEPVAGFVGRGSGLDDAGLARKGAVLALAAARTPPRLEPRTALAEVGGFEIGMMAGAAIAAARARRVVVVDGFIATAAAALALALDPGIRPALVFAHRSAEAGHGAALARLGAEPLLDLGLRLGEGTGALLALPLLRAAAAMLAEMASFASAGVARA